MIIFSLAAASCLIILLSLPVWRINNITVTGNSMISPELVKQKANISFDENIFFVNYREVTRRLKEIPQVKNARLSAKIPSTIEIKIEERTPFAVFLVGGDYIVVDEKGVIIDSVKGSARTQIQAEVSKLPTVIGLPKGSIVDDKRVRPDVMSAIEKSFRTLSPVFTKSKFVLVMKKSDSLSILIDDTLDVKIGYPDNIDRKLSNLAQLLRSAGSDTSKIEYIDVRLVNDPVIRFKK